MKAINQESNQSRKQSINKAINQESNQSIKQSTTVSRGVQMKLHLHAVSQ